MEASSSSRKPIARWDSAGDRLLITELLHHIRKGERINNKFSPEVWAQIAAQVNKPSIGTGIRPLTLAQVKNRYFVMKKGWKDFTALLKNDGFHWDRERGRVDAEKEVWAKYIRVHPKARVFKQKPLENYEDLCEIFGDAEQTTSVRSSRRGRRAGGQEYGEDDDEEDEGEEAEAEGNGERGSSAEKTLTNTLTYQDSPTPGNSPAQENDK
ncbi:unnamed protein product [Tuber aestivum]|uniref:Myb/SANT-like domain-containing protein n=1 Tax=Tuber aestivum TaxID=59557 RepID=A0A292PTA6_9PEZI|nr:unnamed protein product [Tuber aestivum]